MSTFTIGYEAGEYDESVHARAVASHLRTDHTELRVTPEEALGVIPRLATLYDESFADASQIPTVLVSELARRDVTVALSGDGGDEVFGGYNRYVAGTRLWSRLGAVPAPGRRTFVRLAEAVSPGAWDRIGVLADPALPPSKRGVLNGNTVHKLASVVGLASVDEMYARLISTWPQPSALVIGAGSSEPSWLQSPWTYQTLPIE